MAELIEFIPNISEGRDKEVIKKLILSITSLENNYKVKLVNYSSDVDHNRTVFTIIGDSIGIEEASITLCREATLLIDLNKHQGVHPRIGAVDVMPYVPLEGISVEKCVELSKKIAKRIAENLSIPVYLYEESATKKEHKNLANIRKGEFESLDSKLLIDKPDFGPSIKHPTFGATVIGVRKYLIAFNINLDTIELSIAKKIAKMIRESSGGFKCVKAIGLFLESKGCCQVSINFTDYNVTNLFIVFDKVKEEATKNNINIINSELIGLIPLDAITSLVKDYLKLYCVLSDRIIELQKSNYLFDNTLNKFIGDLSSKNPTPGGGSVAALASALAQGLVSMVANFTLKKKYDNIKEEVLSVLDKSSKLIEKYKLICINDISSYQEVSIAFKEKKNVEAALEKAKEPPKMLIDAILESVLLLNSIYDRYNPNLISDFGVAATLFISSSKSAYLNILINDKSLNKTIDSTNYLEKVNKIEKVCNEIYTNIVNILK